MKILITGFAVLLSIAQAVAQPARGGAINNPPGSGSGSSSGPFTNASIYGLTVIGNTVITGTLTANGSGVTNINAGNISSGTLSYLRAGSFTNHNDVVITSLTSGDHIAYNGANGTWTNGPGGSGGGTTLVTNTLVFSRWESQTATSDSTNYVISVTNNLGRFMAHHIQIAATGNVMLHPVCETNAVLSLTITTDSTRNILWPTNFALFNATGVTLANTNWVLPVSAGTLFTASISTNVNLGRRVMYWRTSVW